ncbi:MAG: hypothetical protein WKF75_12515 [Singulisphaera sp.]
MTSVAFAQTWMQARGRGKTVVARMARRVIPRTTVSLAHVEPDVRLTVNLRRHVMFWTGGLAKFEPYSVRVLRAAVERDRPRRRGERRLLRHALLALGRR